MTIAQRALKVHKRLDKQAAALTNHALQRIGKEIYGFRSRALVSVNDALLAPMSYNNHGRIHAAIAEQGHAALKNIVPIAERLSDAMHLFGLLRAGFIARMVTPPWRSVLITSEKREKNQKIGPRLVHQFNNITAEMMRRIERSELEKRSRNETIQVLGDMFPQPKAIEAAINFGEAKKPTGNPADTWAETMTVFDEQPFEVVQGTFDAQDVAFLQDELVDAMGWSSRQYRPWFSDNVKSANRYLRTLEQDIMGDAVRALHEGELSIGNENMGIEDFEWVVTKPQPKCDECCDRDGMTMSEIADKIRDDFGDQAPPLHPNCRCRLIPKIRDEWAESTLSKAGYDWTEDGLSFEPTSGQKKLGYDDMSWDEWLDLVREGA